MNSIVWFALVLLILWIVLRVALAITGAALHLLWIAAVIMFVIWLIGRFRKTS